MERVQTVTSNVLLLFNTLLHNLSIWQVNDVHSDNPVALCSFIKKCHLQVNISLNAAAGRLKKTREERDQFDEANNQIIFRLKTKVPIPTFFWSIFEYIFKNCSLLCFLHRTFYQLVLCLFFSIMIDSSLCWSVSAEIFLGGRPLEIHCLV
jgi:hypothetical protein